MEKFRDNIEQVVGKIENDEIFKVLSILHWHTWVTHLKGKNYIYPCHISLEQARVAFSTAYFSSLSETDFANAVLLYNIYVSTRVSNMC